MEERDEEIPSVDERNTLGRGSQERRIVERVVLERGSRNLQKLVCDNDDVSVTEGEADNIHDSDDTTETDIRDSVRRASVVQQASLSEASALEQRGFGFLETEASGFERTGMMEIESGERSRKFAEEREAFGVEMDDASKGVNDIVADKTPDAPHQNETSSSAFCVESVKLDASLVSMTTMTELSGQLDERREKRMSSMNEQPPSEICVSRLAEKKKKRR